VETDDEAYQTKAARGELNAKDKTRPLERTFGPIIDRLNEKYSFDVTQQTGGFGPSDHSSFYGAGVPVLFLFSGNHADYHKPSDTPDKLNGAGMAATADLVTHLVISLSGHAAPLTFQKTASPAPHGDARSFGASLGTIPDYAGSDGTSGVLLAGVRPGGPAEEGGMRRGDILVKLGKHDIKNVEDLMFVLNESKPGEATKAVVKRDGKTVELDVTFQGPKAKK